MILFGIENEKLQKHCDLFDQNPMKYVFLEKYICTFKIIIFLILNLLDKYDRPMIFFSKSYDETLKSYDIKNKTKVNVAELVMHLQSTVFWLWLQQYFLLLQI